MLHVSNIQYGHLLNKYLKRSVWRLAVRYDIYMTLGGKGLTQEEKLKNVHLASCFVPILTSLQTTLNSHYPQ
jgi:hypothetical protein